MNEILAPAARAATHFQNHDYPNAYNEYALLLETEPGSGYLYTMLGLCRFHEGLLTEAENTIIKGISVDPSYAGLYYLGYSIRKRLNDTAGAEKYLREAMKIKPGDADYIGLLATMELDRGEWQQGFDTANSGLIIEPQNQICRKQQSRALSQLQKPKWLLFHRGASAINRLKWGIIQMIKTKQQSPDERASH